MPVQIYGLNHRTASLDMRGKLTFADDELDDALHELQSVIPKLTEAAILSTCNRMEIHAFSEANTAPDFGDWLAKRKGLTSEEVNQATYTYSEQEAVAHAMRVAAGLDSQILGEPQIQGQFKVAYQKARQAGTLGKELAAVENFTLQTAKRIRTETQIGAEPVSVAYAAITMAKQIFADFSRTETLLIGAGSNIQLIAQYLSDEGAERFTVANRTLANAETLAQNLGGTAISLAEIEAQLFKFDIIVSSTGGLEPIITADMLTQATRERRYKPMFIADLAVPRDVEATAGAIRDIYLHTVDDLSKIITQSLAKREELTFEAERLIKDGVECYAQNRRIQLEASLLRDYRAQVDSIRQTVLDAAIKKIDAGEDPATVISKLAHDLTNQLAHKPTISIRHASALGNEELLDLLKGIYELEN